MCMRVCLYVHTQGEYVPGGGGGFLRGSEDAVDADDEARPIDDERDPLESESGGWPGGGGGFPGGGGGFVGGCLYMYVCVYMLSVNV